LTIYYLLFTIYNLLFKEPVADVQSDYI